MIRKLLIVAAAIYLGKKTYEALVPAHGSEQLGADRRADDDAPLNPVIPPEIADQLRTVTVSPG